MLFLGSGDFGIKTFRSIIEVTAFTHVLQNYYQLFPIKKEAFKQQAFID
jgi:hypothetical protein